VKSVTDLFQSLNIRNLYHQLVEHNQRLTRLEREMSKLTDMIAEMDADTTRIAAKIDDITARLNAGDTSAAAELGPIANRLKALGADPDNPVPPADEPTFTP
jgi:uncharacterized coiled-coil protein SlyX